MLPIPSQAAEFFPSSVAVKIDQKVLFVDQCNKAPLLIDILQEGSVRRALVLLRASHMSSITSFPTTSKVMFVASAGRREREPRELRSRSAKRLRF